jgi:hypothetical protein
VRGGGTVEIRYNDHVIKAELLEIEIQYELNQLAIYRVKAIDNVYTHTYGVHNRHPNCLPQIISEEENPMSDLRTKIINADLPEPTKMLRERGVEDANGIRTTTGTNILMDLLYKQHRDEIAKLVAAVDVEPEPADEIDD